MTWAVRVNEIKMTGRPGVAYELWQGQSWKYAGRKQLREVYTTMYGRLVDVVCDTPEAAAELVDDLVQRGIPSDCLRVVGGTGRVAK